MEAKDMEISAENFNILDNKALDGREREMLA